MPINQPQYDLINAHTHHSINLLRLSEDLNRKLRPILKQLQRDLLAEIAMMPDPTKWQRARLKSLLKFADKAIGDSYGLIDRQTSAFNLGVAGYEQDFTLGNIKGVVGIDMGATLTAEQLGAIASDTLILGAPSAEWWGRQDTKLQNAFKDQMRQGFLRGEGIGKLARRVRPIMDVSRRDAETLARTSVQAVSGEVREKLIASNSDVINGYIHVSTLDNRTSLICITRDGLKWDQNQQPVGQGKAFRRPPLHFNCRSTLVPWRKSYQELGAKFKAQVPEGTRASMNGSVPRGLSYPEWLKTQPKAVQIEVLGERRRDMWQKGGLSLRQLVDQTGRPLTLEQLKK